jgi:hypothetical protein
VAAATLSCAQVSAYEPCASKCHGASGTAKISFTQALPVGARETKEQIRSTTADSWALQVKSTLSQGARAVQT